MKLILLIVALTLTAAPAGSGEPAAQCKRADRVISKGLIRFGRDQYTAVKRDTIQLCTTHEYGLDAENGDHLSIRLAAGSRTSFTLRMPSGDIVKGADGVRRWSGRAPEIGSYTIIIGTDVTARYTLTVATR